ncbi:uncharacterized protein LOC132081884 isoform X2 [Ammospiza nelsoni]|uniref:uncharacterized protein LOC132081884 isoform X2 n=1 Tax=Ammospiza nelsoni TaxID=2857394 RepID=UPI002869C040|nr:uncharacterized protein LOC132081884 isoform X2 [Ammospiza nelsoni]
MRAALRRGRLPGPVGGPGGRQPLVVDLRSDTVTRPCAAMRRAMARAAVGDDDYGEDPAVNELQRRAAATLGTESALFVPTATMANLIAVMCHCQRRGAQLFLGRDAHLHVYEHGGAAQVAGVHSQALPDLPNGTFDLEQLELTIREAHGSRYHPRPELICLENTHSSAGGRALPLTYLRQVRGLADRYGLRVHMDGARLMNAAVAQGVEPAQIAQHCDSVSLCFSKGLGAPAGAVLAGSGQFVAEAWRVRKLLGGGMRQAGVLAAAALLGLQHAKETLSRDHEHARSFAEGTSGPRGCWAVTAHLAQPSSTTLLLVPWAHPCTATLGLQPGEDAAGILTWLQCQDHGMTVPVLCSVTLVPHAGERALLPPEPLGRAGSLFQVAGQWACTPGPPAGVQALDSPLCSVSLAAVETNIVMLDVPGAWPCPAELCERLRAVSEEEEAEAGRAVSVLLLPWSARALRAVWHRDVSARGTELARRKLEFVARKCQEELASGLHRAPPGTGGA